MGNTRNRRANESLFLISRGETEQMSPVRYIVCLSTFVRLFKRTSLSYEDYTGCE